MFRSHAGLMWRLLSLNTQTSIRYLVGRMRIGVSAAAADQLFDALDVEKIGSLFGNVLELFEYWMVSQR